VSPTSLSLLSLTILIHICNCGIPLLSHHCICGPMMLLKKCGSHITLFIISHIIDSHMQLWDWSGIPVGTQSFPFQKGNAWLPTGILLLSHHCICRPMMLLKKCGSHITLFIISHIIDPHMQLWDSTLISPLHMWTNDAVKKMWVPHHSLYYLTHHWSTYAIVGLEWDPTIAYVDRWCY
jgi:hypothetical protein